MPERKVLVLEDDEMWLALHERQLRKAGIPVVLVEDGAEALELASSDPTIVAAVIDEIMLGQDLMGSDVVRKMRRKRPSDWPRVKVVMVTSKPWQAAEGDFIVLGNETEQLMRVSPDVERVVYKQYVYEDGAFHEDRYQWLVDFLKQCLRSPDTVLPKPEVLVGLGIRPELLNHMIHATRRRWARFAEVWEKCAPLALERADEREAKIELLRDQFLREDAPGWLGERHQVKKKTRCVIEKKIFLFYRDSGNLRPCDQVKPGGRAFRVLLTLALKREIEGGDPHIGSKEYDVPLRGEPVSPSAGPPARDPHAVRDFAFGRGDDGDRDGVEFHPPPSAPGALRTAISATRRILQLADDEHPERLSVCSEPFRYDREYACYRPHFDISLVLYAVKEGKTARGGKS